MNLKCTVRPALLCLYACAPSPAVVQPRQLMARALLEFPCPLCGGRIKREFTLRLSLSPLSPSLALSAFLQGLMCYYGATLQRAFTDPRGFSTVYRIINKNRATLNNKIAAQPHRSSDYYSDFNPPLLFTPYTSFRC
jgi:hypothetical protein